METNKNKIIKISGLILVIAIPFLWFGLVPEDWTLGPLLLLSSDTVLDFIVYMNLITIFMWLFLIIGPIVYIKVVLK